MAYIIDTYNQYSRWDREHTKYIFELNEQWYAIKEVILNWGVPDLPQQVDRDLYPETYQIYNTYEDAMEFVHTMKQLN